MDVIPPRTLSSLVADYQDGLKSFFIRCGSNRAQAEDLTQDLFLRLSRHPDLSSIRDPAGYLYQAAHNLVARG